MIVICILGISIFLMLMLIFVLINKLAQVRKRIQIQETVKKVQNLSNYYELSNDKHKHAKDRYEDVYSDSLSSESPSEDSKHITEESDPENLYQSLETVRIGSQSHKNSSRHYKPPFDHDFITAAQPIDQALWLLKMSADQL